MSFFNSQSSVLLEPTLPPGAPCLVLDVPYELPAFCYHCQDEQRFLVRYEVDDGRLAVCVNCGREKRIPFTRTTSEAA